MGAIQSVKQTSNNNLDNSKIILDKTKHYTFDSNFKLVSTKKLDGVSEKYGAYWIGPYETLVDCTMGSCIAENGTDIININDEIKKIEHQGIGKHEYRQRFAIYVPPLGYWFYKLSNDFSTDIPDESRDRRIFTNIKTNWFNEKPSPGSFYKFVDNKLTRTKRFTTDPDSFWAGPYGVLVPVSWDACDASDDVNLVSSDGNLTKMPCGKIFDEPEYKVRRALYIPSLGYWFYKEAHTLHHIEVCV